MQSKHSAVLISSSCYILIEEEYQLWANSSTNQQIKKNKTILIHSRRFAGRPRLLQFPLLLSPEEADWGEQSVCWQPARVEVCYCSCTITALNIRPVWVQFNKVTPTVKQKYASIRRADLHDDIQQVGWSNFACFHAESSCSPLNQPIDVCVCVCV